jgi:hypothetical protein
MQDLVILSPDGAYKEVLPAMLDRHQALGIRPITFTVVSDPFHDSSEQVVELLRPFQRSHARSVVVRDLEGSGMETLGASALERKLKDELLRNGWRLDNSNALVLVPEIESWLRFDSTHLENLIKERARKNQSKVSHWKDIVASAAAEHHGWIDPGKPSKPKEVFHELLRHYRISPSNALLAVLARKESLAQCQVQSFIHFRQMMRDWFPAK